MLSPLTADHCVDARTCDAWCGRQPKALLLEIGTPGVCGPGAMPAFGLPDAEAPAPANPDAGAVLSATMWWCFQVCVPSWCGFEADRTFRLTSVMQLSTCKEAADAAIVDSS